MNSTVLTRTKRIQYFDTKEIELPSSVDLGKRKKKKRSAPSLAQEPVSKQVRTSFQIVDKGKFIVQTLYFYVLPVL